MPGSIGCADAVMMMEGDTIAMNRGCVSHVPRQQEWHHCTCESKKMLGEDSAADACITYLRHIMIANAQHLLGNNTDAF